MDDAELGAQVKDHFAWIGKDEVRAAEIYADDAVLEYVQSGERIRGKDGIIASRQAYPGRRADFTLLRLVGSGSARIAELVLLFDGDDEPHYVAAILEFRDAKVISERIYIAEPWDPPAYRAEWVEPLKDAQD